MRINCAVADDSKTDREKITDALHAITRGMDHLVYISCFKDAKSFDYSTPYDLYILDIDMPEINGFELAEQIHKRNPKAAVVFCTEYENLVYESLKLNTFFFARKSQLEKDLNTALHKYIQNFSHIRSAYTVKNSGAVRVIPYEDILYFEVSHNDLYIHLKSGETVTERKTLKKVLEEVKGEGFLQIDKSLLVNALHVTAVKDNTVYLDSGQKMKVPQSNIRSVLNAYLFFTERG